MGNRCAFFALTPSPSPPQWERGVGGARRCRGDGPVALHIPLDRLRERGTKEVRAKRRACPFTPARGKSPLPQRFCAEPMHPYHTNRAGGVYNCPPPAGSPRFARGTVRVRFPLRAGGTIRRGSSTAVFCELWLGDWYQTPSLVAFSTGLRVGACNARRELGILLGVAGSSNGRTPDSGSGSGGSNPPPAAITTLRSLQ